jgi:hypothetical protein
VITLTGMQQPGQVERVWWPRLRWRLRGAWQWPAFAGLTLVDAVLLMELPFYDRGPGNLVGGALLAGFLNLFAVAIVAPLAGLRLRRYRPDLPRPVASDYAGTGALVAVTLAFVAGGLLHRPALAAERADLAAVVAGTRAYVGSHAPGYRAGLADIDALRVEEDLYRSCVPGPDPQRWLCVFVTTDRRPAGVTLDSDRAPNGTYRMHGGFR